MRTFLNGLLVAVVAVAGVEAAEEATIETDALVQVSKYMDQPAYIINSDFEVVYKVFNTGTLLTNTLRHTHYYYLGFGWKCSYTKKKK